jgi:hypothetical protein
MHIVGSLNFLENPGLIAGALYYALPPVIAIFPQQCSVPSSRLEERFHRYKDSTGKPSILYFSKGL